MFAALAYVLALIAHFLHLSIFPSVSFLTYDPKDIIICIGGLIMGPISALCVSVVVSFIEMITISTTGFYGFVMNIFSTCAFVIPTTLIYKYKRNFKGAILSLVVGFVSTLILMTLWNIIITPMYLGQDRQYIIENLLIYIVGFNAIKVGVNIALVLMLYKPLSSVLKAISLLEKSENKANNVKVTLTMFSIGAVLLITLVIIWIIVAK